MKRFLAFAGSFYYPSGGWDDFEGSFDTVAEAVAQIVLSRDGDGWGHVIDREDGSRVMDGECDYGAEWKW